MSHRWKYQNSNNAYRRFPAGDYALLYNTLLSYDWSPLYNEYSLDVAVNRLNEAVMQAIN
jgi:hypothetical protein